MTTFPRLLGSADSELNELLTAARAEKPGAHLLPRLRRSSLALIASARATTDVTIEAARNGSETGSSLNGGTQGAAGNASLSTASLSSAPGLIAVAAVVKSFAVGALLGFVLCGGVALREKTTRPNPSLLPRSVAAGSVTRALGAPGQSPPSSVAARATRVTTLDAASSSTASAIPRPTPSLPSASRLHGNKAAQGASLSSSSSSASSASSASTSPAPAADPELNAQPSQTHDAAKAPDTESTFRAELEIIERARNALRSGAPSQALTALDEYRSRGGHLLDREALLLGAEALSMQGEVEDASRLARLYLERYPSDVHAGRMNQIAARSGDNAQH